MNMRRKGSKGKWPAKFRRGLSLALCASMAGTGIAAHVALADTEAVVLGDELLQATPDQAQKLEEATPSNAGMSSSLTDGGSGEIGGEEATPSNATFQMLPPDDNILSVGTDEPYQSIQDAINYINEMANFCEKAGADIDEVAAGMGLDSRIGAKFLKAGPGYGGSCFPKDTNAMAFMARQIGISMPLIETTIAENDNRYQLMAERILAAAGKKDAKIGVLGLAFKDGTDDCRTSPAIHIVEALLKNPVKITAFDPKAMNSAKKILGDKINYADSAYDAVKNADIIAVLTEWKEFRLLDMNKLAALAKQKIIMDCRNLLEPTTARNAGFCYHCIGHKD